MCAYSFDMQFTLVLNGWENTTHGVRILLQTIPNLESKFPMAVRGKYYLVDSGCMNMPKFLAPFRGEHYHLHDYREGSKLHGLEELLNYKHSSLHNAIECCFVLLKARFPIPK